jgi:hypothetical protein
LFLARASLLKKAASTSSFQEVFRHQLSRPMTLARLPAARTLNYKLPKKVDRVASSEGYLPPHVSAKSGVLQITTNFCAARVNRPALKLSSGIKESLSPHRQVNGSEYRSCPHERNC